MRGRNKNFQFAIESAGESRRMTLKDIYDYIERKFPYFKHAKPGAF